MTLRTISQSTDPVHAWFKGRKQPEHIGARCAEICRRNPERRCSRLFKLQRKLAFLTVPAVLALGAVSYGSVVAMAAPSHSPTVVKAASTTEPAESTTDTTEANEPALPGGGYADANNVQADTQQEGIN
jgi:hypothetical protein